MTPELEQITLNAALESVCGDEHDHETMRGRLRRTVLNELRALAMAIAADLGVRQRVIGEFFDNRTQSQAVRSTQKARRMIAGDPDNARRAMRILERFEKIKDKKMRAAGITY